MDLLQTPNMQYPGFLSMLFRTLTRTCSSFNSSIFYISFQSSVINVLHFIWLSDILLLVKLVLSSLKYNLNKLLAFQFFNKYSLHYIVYIYWGIFYLSWYHWVLSIMITQTLFIFNNEVSLSILLFAMIINGHKSSLR